MKNGRKRKEGTAQAPPLRKRVKWDLAVMVVSAVSLFGLSMAFPDKGEKALDISWEFFTEMAFILPAVLIAMGLFGVWVDRQVVVKYLGKGSGVAGLFLAILLGTLPTGPLYIAFPLAGMLLKKGARPANVMLFISAWACIKLPQELMELQFLGWRFTVTRLGLTVATLIPAALLAEALYHRNNRDALQPLGENEEREAGEVMGLEARAEGGQGAG